MNVLFPMVQKPSVDVVPYGTYCTMREDSIMYIYIFRSQHCLFLLGRLWDLTFRTDNTRPTDHQQYPDEDPHPNQEYGRIFPQRQLFPVRCQPLTMTTPRATNFTNHFPVVCPVEACV